jgi:glycosyltransferase involved in cell wall biosynthesis
MRNSVDDRGFDSGQVSGSRIAVIIPTYRPGKYLERCLRSLDVQTVCRTMYTVYIGLNGPRDPYEVDLLRVLSDVTFRYEYVYLARAGVSPCRNALLDISTEEFVVFVDDDDVVSENYLQNLLAVSDQRFIGISNVRGFVGDVSRQHTVFTGKSFAGIAAEETSLFRARRYLSSSWAMMLHRDMIGDTRFDPRLARGEDSLFMAQISRRVSGVRKASTDTLYFLCAREGSVTQQPIPLGRELRGLGYLLVRYLRLLVSPQYRAIFIGTRIASCILKIVSAMLGVFLWRGARSVAGR